MPIQSKKLLEQVRDVSRLKHHSILAFTPGYVSSWPFGSFRVRGVTYGVLLGSFPMYSKSTIYMCRETAHPVQTHCYHIMFIHTMIFFLLSWLFM